MRIIFLWMAVLLVTTPNLYSNGRGSEDVSRSSDFTLFEENGKVGLKDEAGQILIPAQYDAIGWSNGRLSVIDEVVGFRSNGLWGLIHTSNRIIAAAAFLNLTPGEGSFLIAQKKSHLSQRPAFGIVNTSGKTVIPFTYDGLTLSNMRAVVMSRSGNRFSFGVTDLTHKIIIPIEYQRIYSLGSLRFAVENFENKTAIFTDDGQPVTAFTIDSLSTFRNDYAIVYQDQRQGLINRNGAFVLKPVHGSVRITDDGTIQTRETNSWLFLDGKNNIITKHKADHIKPLSPDRYAVGNERRVQITDNTFEPLREEFFSSVTEFRDGIALYRNNGKTGALTETGKAIIPAHYESLVKDQHAFLARIARGHNEQWIILDADGKQLTEKHYERIAPFNGHYYAVRNRGYWGAVNRNGKEFIACVHDSLMQQQGNYVVVKFKGEYGVINLNENWVVTPTPHPIALLDNRMYLEFGDKTTFLRSLTGELIYFSDNPLEYDNGYIRETLPSGAYWTIDMSGVVIGRSNQPGEVEMVYPESEGLRAIRKDGKFGFIDAEGRLRIANRYESVKPFSGRRAAIRIRDQWGFIDEQERLVVQPIYDYVENFSNGYAIVTRDNLSGLLDATGKIVLPLRHNEITRNDHNRYLLRNGEAFGLADESGTVVIHPRYDEITDTGNGYVIVKRDGKCGLLTLGGVNTIPMIYDDLTFDAYHDLYIAVEHPEWASH